MTDEHDFAWAFHEEEYKQALELVTEISEFRSLRAEKPSELNIQKERVRNAASRLDEIIREMMEGTSVPRQMIDEIRARRDAAELVEPPQYQVVYAPAAAPPTQNVMVQVVLVTNPASPQEPAQAAPVAEQAQSPEPSTAPATDTLVKPMQRSIEQPELTVAQVEPNPAPAGAEQDKSMQTMQRGRKKETLEDFLMPYLVKVFRSGAYSSGKELHKALVNKAGADDSPFKAGTGRTDALYVTKRGQTLAAGTLNKWMGRVREEAAG